MLDSKFNCKSSVGSLRSADISLSADPNLKADLLQSVFTFTFTPDNVYIPPLANDASTNLRYITFTPTFVNKGS